MEFEVAISLQDFLNMRQLIEVILDALNYYHLLTIAIDSQGLLLQTFRSHLHFGQMTYLCKYRIVS